jgi:hypothetical protein
MFRPRLIELHEQNWFPQFLRDIVTDTLQSILNCSRYHELVAPVLSTALKQARTCRVIDLCSGSGGPWFHLLPILNLDQQVSIYLTDKFPNRSPFDKVELAAGHEITFCVDPVDAERVPHNLEGFRTLFNSFHHFEPERAAQILLDAVNRREGVAIFEVPKRSAITIFMSVIMAVGTLVLLPFLRSFTFSLFLWTYLIPVLPFVMWFDGVVSCLRAYTASELLQLTRVPALQPYCWKVGTLNRPFSPFSVTYLIGYPNEPTA